jgi:hypothetical protein
MVLDSPKIRVSRLALIDLVMLVAGAKVAALSTNRLQRVFYVISTIKRAPFIRAPFPGSEKHQLLRLQTDRKDRT